MSVRNTNSVPYNTRNNNTNSVPYNTRNNAQGAYFRRRTNTRQGPNIPVKSIFNINNVNSTPRLNRTSIPNNKRQSLNARLDNAIKQAKYTLIYVRKKRPREREGLRYKNLKKEREYAKKLRTNPKSNLSYIETSIRSLYNKVGGFRNIMFGNNQREVNPGTRRTFPKLKRSTSRKSKTTAT